VARIGEILVQDGVVTAEGRERALQSQAVHGGRMGTNLIEQFACGLDDLAEGLARQHDMPAALDRHFSQADPTVQKLLSPATAARWRAVPLGRLPGEGGKERVAVALLDPPTDEALAALAAELRREVVAAIAPELRVLYHLERVYGIERDNRFKRGARRSQIMGVIALERRAFVRTISELDSATLETESSLARIEVRRVERTRTGEIETLTDLGLLGDALVAVKRAINRERVGELLVGAIEQGFDHVFSAALILTVRAGLLFGWRGFARGRDPSAMERVGAVAVPLHVESMFARPCSTGRPYFGPAPAGGSETDRKLWRFLGVGEPVEVGVHPLQVFGEVATVLYVHASRPIPASAPSGIAELGQSLCHALQRMVQVDQER
jgi:Type II secretion system (T2SS), protein E, N-terminal domain